MGAVSILVSGRHAFFSEEDMPLVNSFRWKLSRNYVRQSNGREQFFHRMIFSIEDGRCVDHIDGNTLNNTRENLRICSHSENMRNRKTHKNNQSGLKGVYLDRGHWRAQIRANGTKKYLGSFKTKEEAHGAYCKAAKELHGDFHREK